MLTTKMRSRNGQKRAYFLTKQPLFVCFTLILYNGPRGCREIFFHYTLYKVIRVVDPPMAMT